MSREHNSAMHSLATNLRARATTLRSIIDDMYSTINTISDEHSSKEEVPVSTSSDSLDWVYLNSIGVGSTLSLKKLFDISRIPLEDLDRVTSQLVLLYRSVFLERRKELNILDCVKCKASWQQRNRNLPLRCPRCNARDWKKLTEWEIDKMLP